MKVYVIAETGGAVKVGIAGDATSRLDALQTANPRRLRLVHSEDSDNARLVERVAHYLLREKRQAGEKVIQSPKARK